MHEENTYSIPCCEYHHKTVRLACSKNLTDQQTDIL